MTLKHLVFALAVAAACAVAPSSPRDSTEAVGDTFEMGKAVAKDEATLAELPKLRGASEGHRPAGRGLSAGPRGRQRADRRRQPQLPLRLPRVHPPHRSRPRFLPQGREGDDTLTATGDYNELNVCPASALPPDPNLVSFRRAATTTTR